MQKGPQDLPAGDIGERLRLPFDTLLHLNHLRYVGLVSSRRESRTIIYTTNYKTMNSLLTFLTEDCCADRTEIYAPWARDAANTVEPQERRHDAAALRRFRIRQRKSESIKENTTWLN